MAEQRQPGSVALTCPHCGERKVETAERLWVARGMLFRFRYGSHVVVGCRRCVRRASLLSALANLLLGWWCFPWGALTPGFVIQNVVRAFWPGQGVLTSALRAAGVDPAAVTIDERGLTGVQRAVLQALYAYTARLAQHGPAEPMITAAATIAAQLTDGVVTSDEARAGIAMPPGHVWVSELTSDARHALAELVAAVCAAPGTLTDGLRAAAVAIGQELGLSEYEMLSLLGAHDDCPTTEEYVADAYLTLGLDASASAAEVKDRYRELLLRYHPDHAAANDLDVETATALTQRLTAAHEVITAHQAQAADVA